MLVNVKELQGLRHMLVLSSWADDGGSGAEAVGVRESEVISDRKLGDEAQILVQKTESQLVRLVGSQGKFHRVPGYLEAAAAVRGLDTSKNLDDCGLPGNVHS